MTVYDDVSLKTWFSVLLYIEIYEMTKEYSGKNGSYKILFNVRVRFFGNGSL